MDKERDRLTEADRALLGRLVQTRTGSALRQAGFDLGTSLGEAIVPVMTGDSVRAVALSQRLFQRDINAQPIIAPAIPERLARLRFFVSSEHAPDDIAASAKTIGEEFSAMNGAFRRRSCSASDRQ